MQANIARQIEISLRVASAVVFCIGSALIIPKVADAIKVLNSSTSNNIQSIESNSQTLNTESSSDIYEPPDNGSPDSQHGTGTR